MPVFRFPSFRSSSNNSNSALKTDSNLNSFNNSSFVNGSMKINNTTDQIGNHSNGNQDENDDDEDDEDEDDEDDKDDDENINHINSIGTRKNPNIFFKKVLSRKNLTPQLKAFKRIASELQNETRPLEYEIQHENAITKIIKDEDEILSSPIASNLLNSKLYSPDEDNLKKYEIITKANEQWNNHNHNQNQQTHQNHQSQQIRLQNTNLNNNSNLIMQQNKNHHYYNNPHSQLNKVRNHSIISNGNSTATTNTINNASNSNSDSPSYLMSRSNSLSSLKSEGGIPPSATITTTTNSLKRKTIDDTTNSSSNGNNFMNLNTKRRIVSLSPVIGAVSPKSNNISIIPMTTTPPPQQAQQSQQPTQIIHTINNSPSAFPSGLNNTMISNNENSFNFYNNFNNSINHNNLLPRSRRNSNKLMQSTSDDLEMMSLK
ncbi:hypothetical protein BVG19_g4683 [[Candida] boidinii]|nr:hypothetical protein BVG19_g4683 [[Candida] boidinii]OWB53331.1 hypothetical protein B5S27_g4925 [[Candida] boidinii]